MLLFSWGLSSRASEVESSTTTKCQAGRCLHWEPPRDDTPVSWSKNVTAAAILRQSGDCPALSDMELSLQRSIRSPVFFPGLRGQLRLEWEKPAGRTAYSIKTPPGGKLACLLELCRAPGLCACLQAPLLPASLVATHRPAPERGGPSVLRFPQV